MRSFHFFIFLAKDYESCLLLIVLVSVWTLLVFTQPTLKAFHLLKMFVTVLISTHSTQNISKFTLLLSSPLQKNIPKVALEITCLNSSALQYPLGHLVSQFCGNDKIIHFSTLRNSKLYNTTTLLIYPIMVASNLK